MLGPDPVEEMWVETATLDGLGYNVRWGTRAAVGHFRFSNPRAAWLEEFERVLFQFARQIVAASGAARFESQLVRWAEYREPLKYANPGATTDPTG